MEINIKGIPSCEAYWPHRDHNSNLNFYISLTKQTKWIKQQQTWWGRAVWNYIYSSTLKYSLFCNRITAWDEDLLELPKLNTMCLLRSQAAMFPPVTDKPETGRLPQNTNPEDLAQNQLTLSDALWAKEPKNLCCKATTEAGTIFNRRLFRPVLRRRWKTMEMSIIIICLTSFGTQDSQVLFLVLKGSLLFYGQLSWPLSAFPLEKEKL